MSYIVECIPLLADAYLCDILDDEGEIILTLTTEISNGSVAVYYGNEIARESVSSFTDRKTILDTLKRLVWSIEMPTNLRNFAALQIAIAQ